MSVEQKTVEQTPAKHWRTTKKPKIKRAPPAKIFDWNPQVIAIHQLRINVKSLAAESKLIRHEEKRCGQCDPCSHAILRWHRITDLREASRYAGLALAFVRGKTYRSVEKEGSRPVEPAKLASKISKFWYV